jgi:nuclear pore complex protein Nup133
LQIFRQLVKKMLLGKVLTLEEIADVQSLQDNIEEDKDGYPVGPSNYVTALNLLSLAKSIPAARLEAAFAAVWRRIYIHDEYVLISKKTRICHVLMFFAAGTRSTRRQA